MPELSIVDLSRDQMQALASRLGERLSRRLDGTLALDANASDLGVEPTILAQVQTGIDQLNAAVGRKEIVIDEQLGIVSAATATDGAPVDITEYMTGWLELDHRQTEQLVMALGVVAALAVIVALIFAILAVSASFSVPSAVAPMVAFAAISLYVAVNAVWLLMKISFANTNRRGVRLRFHARDDFLGIFIVHQIDVEGR